jgi:hypothetical protein
VGVDFFFAIAMWGHFAVRNDLEPFSVTPGLKG